MCRRCRGGFFKKIVCICIYILIKIKTIGREMVDLQMAAHRQWEICLEGHFNSNFPCTLYSYTAELLQWMVRPWQGGRDPLPKDIEPVLTHGPTTTCWVANNVLHQPNGEPAVVMEDGTKFWFCDGLLHRPDDKPAVELASGQKGWFQRGIRCRDNDQPTLTQPAMAEYDGFFVPAMEVWHDTNNLVGRGGDKPAIRYADGDVEVWLLHGRRGRAENKPSRVSKERREWYMDNCLSRGNDEPAIEFADGRREWFYSNVDCRISNGPTIECADGTRMWTYGGKLHRSFGPAIEYVDGTREWYVHGLLSSCANNGLDDSWFEMGPAQIFPNGEKRWYLAGRLDREDGLPAVIYEDGIVEYWTRGVQVPLPKDTVWTRMKHEELKGYRGHAAVNHMLGTFLLGYTKACDLNPDEGRGHYSLIEDMLEEGVFGDYFGAKRDV